MQIELNGQRKCNIKVIVLVTYFVRLHNSPLKLMIFYKSSPEMELEDLRPLFEMISSYRQHNLIHHFSSQN